MNIIIKLFLGIFIISWSSILIRWMGDIHPLVISFYRLFFSALFILPFILKKLPSQRKNVTNFFPYIFFAGLFLALHFYTWISSLQMTTVGNSIFLESTHPLFGLLLSIIILKEKGSKYFIPALIFGLAGMYLTVCGDIHNNPQALYGDLLAVLAAFCLAAYLLIARILKDKFLLLPYLFFIYGMAAIFLFTGLIIYDLDYLNLSLQNWIILITLAAGPNLIGHSILNWASRKMEIFKVNMALFGESILATSLAAILLGEIPNMEFYFGALLIIAAILSVFLSKKQI